MKALRVAVVSLLLIASAPYRAQAEAQAPAAQPAMPQGHPAVGAAPAPAAPEQDAVFATPEVPAGSILVRLVNEKGEAVPNADIKLGILFQKIAEGEQREERHLRTDAKGVARFSGLTASGDFSYRVTTRSGDAQYESEPIQLKSDMGVLVLLHVYPVTRDINAASIGSRGFVYVETRDAVFQFEVLFRVFNMGGVTWVPNGALMKLPAGFKAFKPGEAMGDARFEEVPGRGVQLAGTFSPGQHNVSFRFQVPRHEESNASFRFGLPPHTAEIRFIAEAAPGMQLDVDGFEKPQADVSNGQRVLVTRHVAKRGEAQLSSFDAALSGIPTPGIGRWIAVLIALGLAGLGAAVFKGMVGQESQAELQERDAERARHVLLDELVDLTRARHENRIGPGTFESARRSLVEALSRIVSTHPELGKKTKKAASGTSGRKAKKAPVSERVRPSGPPSTA